MVHPWNKYRNRDQGGLSCPFTSPASSSDAIRVPHKFDSEVGIYVFLQASNPHDELACGHTHLRRYVRGVLRTSCVPVANSDVVLAEWRPR